MAEKNQPNRKSTKAPQPAATKSAPTPAAPQPVAAKADGVEVWRHDYDYVIRDLRRLLIVSGSLFLIIIILGFFM